MASHPRGGRYQNYKSILTKCLSVNGGRHPSTAPKSWSLTPVSQLITMSPPITTTSPPTAVSPINKFDMLLQAAEAAAVVPPSPPSIHHDQLNNNHLHHFLLYIFKHLITLNNHMKTSKIFHSFLK
jgi:hypothetical protein